MLLQMEEKRMKKEDLIYLCTMVGNLSGIPVRLYEEDKQVFYHSLVHLLKDPFALAKDETLSLTGHVGFYVTPRFFYYGVVVSGNTRMVVGPSRQTAAQDQELKDIAFELDIRQDDVSEFVSAMKQIIRLPLESLMQMMCVCNFMVNGEKMSLNDIVGSVETPFDWEGARTEQRMAEMESTSEALHNSLAVEQTLMNIIRKGDVAALEAFVQDAPAVRSGVMAREQLRQAKNTFIVATAESCRAAIRGGMDVEEALTSSDAYIQQCEMMTDIHRITRLQYDMVHYYTRQVERVRHGNYATELVRSVANYVQHHLSEAITTDQIAAHCSLSRQHLSRRFTQEAGVPLAAFVRKEKIEEAKRLLRYTDKTVSAIGLYLGFAGQGHFVRVFKDMVGMTPGEYREKKRG